MISIRRRLMGNLLGASLLLLTGGLLAMYIAAHMAVLDQFDDALRAKALAVSTLTVNDGGDVRVNFNDEFLRGFDDDRPRDFFALWHLDGTLIARSESLGRRELTRPEGKLKRARYWNLTLPNGRPGRAMAFPFKPERSRASKSRTPEMEVHLVVASDRRELNETLHRLLGVAAISGVLLLGASLLIIPRVLRRGLQPLDRLGNQAAQIDASSLAARFPMEDLPAELRPIAGRLNDLLQRIEQSFERERRFSDDLAHELRTPLAELRSQAECALKWPDARDPALDCDTLAISLRMESLVTSMLTLARGDKKQLSGQIEPVTLAPFVAQAWESFAPRAAARGLRVSLDLEPVTAAADPALLRSVLNNLFENAVDYTPANGAISIALKTLGARAVLNVQNPSDNLAPEDAGRLFERFWRKDAARTGDAHFGLGLSLAVICAEAMGWTLTATIDEQRIVRFSLSSGLLSSGSREPSVSASAS